MIDHRIAMMGQQPNIIGQLTQGTQAAGQTAALQRQAQFQNMLRHQGSGIMQGDQNALAAMAQYDPQAALGVQQSRQSLTIGKAQLEQIRQSTRIAAQQQAANMNAAEAARESQLIQQGLMRVIPLVEQAKQTGDVTQLNQTMQTLGLPPVRDVNEALVQIAQYEGVYEVLTRVQEQNKAPEQPKPSSTPGKLMDDFRRGLITEEQMNAALQGKPGEQFSVEMPDGTRVQYGPDNQVAEGSLDVSSPGAMVDSIDSLLGDDALSSSTGWRSILQAVPGTPQYRVGTKVRQLEGQAFLQAFESLKGGGQITEIEGQKATQAIGRLDSAQSPKDYREALQELRHQLIRAIERPRGWADTSAGKITQMSVGEIAQLDFKNMSAEELKAARQRLEELKRGK